jgi:hypothetical protein
MPSTLEKYRLLNEDESDITNCGSSSEELTDHEYLSRNEVSIYKFSKFSIIVIAFLCVSVISNIIMALTLRKVWVPAEPTTKLGEFFVVVFVWTSAFTILIRNA